MATTYILVDAQKRAILIPESRIEAEAGTRWARGEKFQIYRATPMEVRVNLTELAGPGPATGGRPAAAPTPTRRKAARRGTGRVGRPKVNVGPCTVPGCKRTAKTRGLCSAHYQQHRRLMRQGKPGLMKAGAATATATAAKPGRKKAAKKAPTRKKATRKTAKKATRPGARKAARQTPRKVAKKTARTKARTTQAPAATTPPTAES